MLSTDGRLPGPPDRRTDPSRRHVRPQLLRPLLLQLPPGSRLRRGTLFLIIGLGQYPNLGVTDGFAVLRRATTTSWPARPRRSLGSHGRLSGPLRIEVLEGLHRLRVVLEPTPEAPDLSFRSRLRVGCAGSVGGQALPPQLERVTFDTQRFVQTGRWSGTLTVDGETLPVTPDTWRGNRDRSWGVRPSERPSRPDGAPIRRSRASRTSSGSTRSCSSTSSRSSRSCRKTGRAAG